MEKIAKLHTTKHCSSPVFGYLLEEGDILQENDLYDSTAGNWSQCMAPGARISSGFSAVWVRPKTTQIDSFNEDPNSLMITIKDLERAQKSMSDNVQFYYQIPNLLDALDKVIKKLKDIKVNQESWDANNS